ncbi:MAG: tRNA (adenosine(37)-N6)-dimethylallyltransferase MiaA [Alphaproteobacteria bacterium]|nr:tRNA (adenosine(37)-N6)-dimethylallyltransferase MiaA [Alphaproteobacteria bacterium]
MSLASSAVILVAGPTASGKSALAAMLAAQLNGTVINADAMQVYRDLPILTAQPDDAQSAAAPHRLYAEVPPSQAFSAGQWLTAARQALTEALTAGRTPILCGGTGMYFQSLINGLAEIPPIPLELRARLRADYERVGERSIRAQLAQHDQSAAEHITVGDRLRLLRALEIVLATGKTQRAWQASTTGGIGTTNIIPILLLPERTALYAACDQRFTNMVERGAIAEVKALQEQALDPTLPAMKTIGVPEITDFLAGKCDWATALSQAQQATRNYAKRQLTWFRNQWQSNKIGFATPPILLHDFYNADMLHGLIRNMHTQPVMKL